MRTNSPIPFGSSVESCTAVFVNGKFLLFDIGNGALNSMEESQLPLPELAALFLTHFHSDHWADISLPSAEHRSLDKSHGACS